jgi:uncharacterized membrane protein
MTLIAPDNHLAIMAALFVIAALGFLGEKTRVGAQLTGAVITILAAILAANVGLIPHSAPAYSFVFTYLVPPLIPLFLFQADLRKILFETTRTTGAFLLATVGTVAGVTLAVLLLDVSSLGSGAGLPPDQQEAAIAGLFASTYIGGSVNYAALGEITGLNRDASFFSAATATDNLFSALYLGLLALLPGLAWLRKRFPDHDHQEAGDAPAEPPPPITAMSLVLSMAVALSIVAISDAAVTAFDLKDWRYVIITAITLALATAIPGLHQRLAGSFELGVGLSFIFFASIAAGADVVAMVSVAPLLIVLVLILLSVHLVILLGLGSALRLSLPELITASNAAILGATTAPALAATKGWKNLVTPGVLVGVLGYALGTFIGTLLFKYGSALFT